MSDLMLDQYEEYREDFKAWGREFHKNALTYNQFERLKLEQEELQLQEECGERLSKKQRARRDEIESLLLTHASYFADGPRVSMMLGGARQPSTPRESSASSSSSSAQPVHHPAYTRPAPAAAMSSAVGEE